jgi:hypothetical protein
LHEGFLTMSARIAVGAGRALVVFQAAVRGGGRRVEDASAFRMMASVPARVLIPAAAQATGSW